VHLQGKSRDQVRFRGKIEYVRSLFTFLRRNRPGSYPLVRLLYPLKSLLGVVLGTLGLVTARGRVRWAETAAVLGWQLCGCPRGFGLSMASEPKYLTLRDNARVLESHLEAFNDFDSKTKQQKLVKDLRHKKTVEFASGGRTYLVKMYKVGSWGRRIAAWFGGSKATREFRVSLELQRRGLPAVPLVAMRETGDLRWVACEKLEGWEQLQGVLLSDATAASRRRDLCRRYGLFARRLHDAGVWQYDFNPSNILVRNREMLLIDFERARVRNRALPESERLYFVAKMNRLPKLSRTDRLRFLHGYVAAHATEAAQLGRIVADLGRRGLDQRETDLDRVEDRCTAENRDFGAFDLGEASGHYLKVRPERPAEGVTLEEVRTAMGTGSPFRIQEVEDALEGWRGANRKVSEGGPVPLAVIQKKGERNGRIVFRN
jgi:tRNA A-37 threonylcarbamoyl transferase component Bud32